MQREHAKTGVLCRAVTRLPFPVWLRASKIKCARTVFGNEAGAVRFFMAAAWFAGGCANIKFHPSRRHHSRIGEKLKARRKACGNLFASPRFGVENMAVFRSRQNR